MRTEIYQWIKNLAVYYILLTVIMHLIPEEKYARYVRFFMGMFLILMLCIPIAKIWNRGSDLLLEFEAAYYREESQMLQQNAQNIQELYLQEGYEAEIRKQMLRVFENTDIKLADVVVHIEKEGLHVIFYVEEPLSAEQERRVADEFRTYCRDGKGKYQVQTVGNGETAVVDSSADWSASGSGSTSGFR